MEEVEKSQEFISKQYDSVLITVSKVTKQYVIDFEHRINDGDNKIVTLYNHDYNIDLRLDELEQHSR